MMTKKRPVKHRKIKKKQLPKVKKLKDWVPDEEYEKTLPWKMPDPEPYFLPTRPVPKPTNFGRYRPDHWKRPKTKPSKWAPGSCLVTN